MALVWKAFFSCPFSTVLTTIFSIHASAALNSNYLRTITNSNGQYTVKSTRDDTTISNDYYSDKKLCDVSKASLRSQLVAEIIGNHHLPLDTTVQLGLSPAQSTLPSFSQVVPECVFTGR